MYIHPKGSPSAPVWVIVDAPLSGDKDKRYLFSAPLGFVFDKMMRDAGIKDYYITSHHDDSDQWNSFRNVIGMGLEVYKPPIIIPLGAVGKILCSELEPVRKKKNYNPDKDSEISKYAGSILTSVKLSYPHYIIPTFHIEDIVKQWKLRDIVVSCDLGKAASEYEFYKQHGHLDPLPKREYKIDFQCFDELLAIIDGMLDCPYVSNDIETIYPKAPTKTQKSQFYKIHPGYPITIGLASSPSYGISFNLFRESNTETAELWRHLYKLLYNVPSIGQNFFNFDANFYEALGFELPLEKCRDTMLRHHILWPELPHKLQFLTRQYTREPYYKDEGHGWSIKNMRKMKIYNIKDVCVSYEVFNAQEEEYKDRPWLKG